MTLVVARTTPLGVRIAADMRITYEDATKRGFLHAELKAIVLSPTLCVAFAGCNVATALDGIRAVASAKPTFEQAKSHLLAAHQDSGRQNDFLVATLRPAPVLAVVKAGVAEDSEAGWLGDSTAFDEYQRHYHEGPGLLLKREHVDSSQRLVDLTTAARMSEGMNAVVHGPVVLPDGTLTIPTGGAHAGVGEAVVSVVPRAEDNLFAYALQSRADAGTVRSEPLPASGVVPSTFGSAAAGSFTYRMLVPAQPGVGAVGLYFIEGELGVLYAPLVTEHPKRYRSVSLDQFRELVRLEWGINLRG